ncbi:hypothetical protein [Gallibacterium genomosp. 3]|uniref:hypothetical protein n=1 Tax=Gallibacterium genomosp. 3 TaxID=505345 RepID=UPI0012E76E56|nr:hypothetical protein [Gallibacterium genomosp. 3]
MMGIKAMNTNLEKMDHIHRVQRRNLKKRIEMIEKGGLVEEIQKDYLRTRVQELSQAVK